MPVYCRQSGWWWWWWWWWNVVVVVLLLPLTCCPCCCPCCCCCHCFFPFAAAAATAAALLLPQRSTDWCRHCGRDATFDIKNVINRFLGWKRRVWVWILERQESCGVRWAWLRLKILGRCGVCNTFQAVILANAVLWFKDLSLELPYRVDLARGRTAGNGLCLIYLYLTGRSIDVIFVLHFYLYIILQLIYY